MESRICGNEYRQIMVCVDSYCDAVPTGRFYNSFFPEGKEFSSLTQFLIKMDAVLDAMKLPQSFTSARTFFAPARQGKEDVPDTIVQTGKLATFAVRVLFRQNASWQGSVAWMEGEMEQGFRSVLELILLMDSVLSERQRALEESAAGIAPKKGKA